MQLYVHVHVGRSLSLSYHSSCYLFSKGEYIRRVESVRMVRGEYKQWIPLDWTAVLNCRWEALPPPYPFLRK